jgi:hypothetical protein
MPGSGLLMVKAGIAPNSKDRDMKTRRMAYWWFRFVVSGRFLEKFLGLRR